MLPCCQIRSGWTAASILAAQNVAKLLTLWNTGFLNVPCYMKLVKTFLGVKTYHWTSWVQICRRSSRWQSVHSSDDRSGVCIIINNSSSSSSSSILSIWFGGAFRTSCIITSYDLLLVFCCSSRSMTPITDTHHRHLSSARFFALSYPSHMLLISCSLFLPLVRFPVILPSRMSGNNTSRRRTCPSHLRFRWFIVLMIQRFSLTRFRTSELLTFAVQLIFSIFLYDRHTKIYKVEIKGGIALKISLAQNQRHALEGLA